MNGIGIVFNIDDLGGGFYGSKAWRIFMRTVRPENIIGCTLREGDTSETLDGSQREFCIAVFGVGLDTDLVKKTFESCSEEGLAAPGRRFISSPHIGSEPLMDVGFVDSAGRLVQDEWSRTFHDRCKDCGWGFAPKSVGVGFPLELKAELENLRNKAVCPTAGSGEKADGDVSSEALLSAQTAAPLADKFVRQAELLESGEGRFLLEDVDVPIISTGTMVATNVSLDPEGILWVVGTRVLAARRDGLFNAQRFTNLLARSQCSEDERPREAYALKEQDATAASLSLMELLQDHGERTRAIAAVLLGELKMGIAVDRLIQRLNDESGLVISASAHALGEIGNPSAVNRLIQILNQLKSKFIFVEAAAPFGSDQTGSNLLSRELNKLQVFFSYELMMCLAKLADKRAIGPIASLLTFPEKIPSSTACPFSRPYREDAANALIGLLTRMPDTDLQNMSFELERLERALKEVGSERCPYVSPMRSDFAEVTAAWNRATTSARQAINVIRKKRRLIQRLSGSLR